MGDEITVDTGKSKITLDELGSIQPGMARSMAEIAPRIDNCYPAAKTESSGLAGYVLREGVKTMQTSMLPRPKYVDNNITFITEACDAVRLAVEKEDPELFEQAHTEMVEGANAYHELDDKAFIHWQVPAEPPNHLDHTG